MTRLAILSTHPIQYNAPAFAALARDPRVELRVFYEWRGPIERADPEFGHSVVWDIPLLDGYDHVFLENRAKHPGTDRFFGIDNPRSIAAIAEWRPDVLLVYGWSFATHVRVLRHFHGRIPVAFRGDSTLLDETPGPRVAIRRRVLRWVYRHVDEALYPGAASRDYYLAHGLNPAKLRWAPHAVDNGRFTDADEARECSAAEWRQHLGIAPEDTVFLFAAKLVERKSPHLLLDAFVKMKDQQGAMRSHLVFAGDGPLMQPLKTRAVGRSDVHFLGFTNQSVMPIVYRVGNVMVLPSSRGETWGLAVNESLASGRPVVVSDRVGCARDLVHEGESGWTFGHDSLEGLEAVLASAADDPKRLQAMRASSRNAIEIWSIGNFARAVIDSAEQLHASRR